MSVSNRDMTVLTVDDGVSNYPRILSFPQGVPASHSKIELKVSLKGSNNKRKRIIQGDLNGMTFRGTDFENDGKKKNYCQFVIGVLDDDIGLMRLVPAEHAYVMRTVIKPVEEDSSTAIKVMDNNERKQSLTDAFGSRKSKTVLKAELANKISSSNIAGVTALEHAIEIKSSTTNKNDENDYNEDTFINAAKNALDENRMLMLPVYNELTDRVEDAYPLESLIPAAVQEALKAQYKALQMATKDDQQIKQDTITPEYWRGLLSYIDAPDAVLFLLRQRSPITNESNLNEESLCQLILLTYLIQFYVAVTSKSCTGLTHQQVTHTMIFPSSKMGTPITRFITDTFTSREKKHTVKFFCIGLNIDKLALHILALVLRLSFFSVVLNPIAAGLHIAIDRLYQLAKELGCKLTQKKIDTETGTGPQMCYVAQLVVPLKFPEKRKPKTGRR